MGFLTTTFLGVRIWIWFYLVFSMLSFAGVLIWFYRERIKCKYYELRFPEKLIKVVMHYPSKMFRIYWRLIPDEESFTIESKTYSFEDKSLLKDNELFTYRKDTGHYLKVNKKEYLIDDLLKIKTRWKRYPEVHYFFNKPSPIDFDFTKKKIDISASQLDKFKKSDLFVKLLTLTENKQIIVFAIILGILNLLGIIFLIAKQMGYIK